VVLRLTVRDGEADRVRSSNDLTGSLAIVLTLISVPEKTLAHVEAIASTDS
jgi:hypothetical protein